MKMEKKKMSINHGRCGSTTTSNICICDATFRIVSSDEMMAMPSLVSRMTQTSGKVVRIEKAFNRFHFAFHCITSVESKAMSTSSTTKTKRKEIILSTMRTQAVGAAVRSTVE